MRLGTRVEDLIARWPVPRLDGEGAYRDALRRYLEAEVADVTVATEETFEKSRRDIVVEKRGLIFTDRVVIEIKLDLVKRSEADRLVGQVVPLLGKRVPVLIVLVGDTRSELMQYIRDRTGHYVDLVGLTISSIIPLSAGKKKLTSSPRRQ